MNDKVIAVKENDLNVEKVYLNNIRVEEGILKSTVTCTDSDMKKVQHEVSKIEVKLVDVLAPAALEALGLEAADAPVENKETGVEKKKKADAEKTEKKGKDAAAKDGTSKAGKQDKKVTIKKPAEKPAGEGSDSGSGADSNPPQ